MVMAIWAFSGKALSHLSQTEEARKMMTITILSHITIFFHSTASVTICPTYIADSQQKERSWGGCGNKTQS